MTSDARWAQHVSDRFGLMCVACGHYGYVEHDHIWPKSQGRKDPRVRDVLNGAPLCGQWCSWCKKDGRQPCHPAKTAGRLKYQPEWLHPDQIAYLAEVGWVSWGEDGEPYGPGMRHFESAQAGKRMIWPALVR